MLLWTLCIVFIVQYKWLKYGGQDFIYLKESTKGNLEDLIKSNEDLLTKLNKTQYD